MPAKRISLALVVAFAFVAAAAQQPDLLHRGADYPGAAAFPELGTMTIVYPAGKGEPVERNRRSAEARARWLAAVYKAKVEVAPDDHVSEAQRAGNLLILGWSNRIWDTLEIEKPFQHGPEGLGFLGLAEADPDVDLLLFHRNPVGSSSFLLFWSRIDPGRDRFQVIPRVGSDWAMYSDYLVLRQGMFKPAQAWPPARSPSAEGDHTRAAAERARRQATLESKSYRALFDGSAFQEPEVREILATREAALAKAVAAIGAPPEGFRITLHLFDTVENKKLATGVADPAHSLPAKRSIFLVRPHARSASPHEEVHVLAELLYGQCVSSGLYEGLALAVENSWRGDPLEWHAARMRSEGRFPPLADLLDEQTLRALPEDRGLLGTAIFVAWLRGAQGAEAVRKIYALPEVGLPSVAKALGTSESALESTFLAWVDAQVTARRADLDFDAAEAEAQRRQRVGDWPGMAAALQKALAARPGDAQTLFNLASAQMRADALDAAEGNLKKLLEAPLQAADSRFRIFGHYQLGRVYDLEGKRESALAEYRRVLELPDEHGAHELARQRIAAPATPEHLE
jgi:hypothetical protein